MSESFDRREFARKAALASIAAGIGASTAPADEKPLVAGKPQEPPLAAPRRLLLEFLRQEFPHENLTPGILDSIEQEIGRQLNRGKVLRSVELPNGAAPFIFQAYRAD